MLTWSMILSGLGKPSLGFLDPMKWTMGLNHERLDQLLLISNMLDLKSGGMKVSTWQDPVVLRLFSLRTTRQPFAFLRVGGHRRLDTQTKLNGWTYLGYLNNSNENILDWSMLVHHYKQQISSPSLSRIQRSGNQPYDLWVFRHNRHQRRSRRRWKPAQGNLYLQQRLVLSNAQGNLHAHQWHHIAGYSLNFVVDLIRNLVIVQESFRKIAMSSDVRKTETLHLDQTEWTFETKLQMQSAVQQFNIVQFWFGLVFHALVAQHGHMWTCNMNQPNWKLNTIEDTIDMFLRRFGHQWSIFSILFDIWIQWLLSNGQHTVSIGSLRELRSFAINTSSFQWHSMDVWSESSTKKVSQLRNLGLLKLIVIQSFLLLMDCLVMEIMITFREGVQTWRKRKHTLSRWRTWSIKLSSQRPAQKLNRRLLLLFVFFRSQNLLPQWRTTDVFLRPKSRKPTTPPRRMQLVSDPGNRCPKVSASHLTLPQWFRIWPYPHVGVGSNVRK